MHVIRRRKGETIVINDDITVSVFEIRRDSVRLAIVGPRDASIHRLEVWEAMHAKQTRKERPNEDR